MLISSGITVTVACNNVLPATGSSLSPVKLTHEINHQSNSDCQFMRDLKPEVFNYAMLIPNPQKLWVYQETRNVF